MEFMKVIAMRKSTRKYKEEQISDESLRTIINAGCAAPVGMGDYDSVHLTVIQNADLLNRIAKTAAKAFGAPNVNPLYGAPTLVIVSCKPNAKAPNGEIANAACLIENMTLAATNLGIGSVYLWSILFAFKADEELLKELELAEGFFPISSIALGHSTEQLTEKELKQTLKTNIIK